MSNSVIMGISSGTKEFLAKSERLLAEGSLQAAADFAQARLSSFPDDMEAQIILARALMGMGEHDRALEILRVVRIRISKWDSILNSLDSSGVPAHDDLKRNMEKPAPHPGRERGSNSMSSAQKGPDQNQDAPALFKEFYTLTMAELFLKQGHSRSAREVLQTILKNNPSDSEALKKLKEIDLALADKGTVLDSSKRRILLNEMERWISKLRNAKDAAPQVL